MSTQSPSAPPARSTRRTRGTIKLILAGLVAAGVAAIPSMAVGGTNPPFAIDGAVPDATAANGLMPDAFGNVKELGPMNASSTKIGVIHAAPPPMLAKTNPNGQVDLRRAWVQSTRDADNDVWVYFAWERDANSGSGYIAYEFMQDKPDLAQAACVYDRQVVTEAQFIAGCNPWNARKAGDFLILWDQSGGNTALVRRTWTNGPSGLVLGAGVPVAAAFATYSPDGFKGEAAINLTDEGIFTTGCKTFAGVIPSTVTGNSDTADYKDTILEPSEPITNCGTLVIQKVTRDGSGQFDFTSNIPGHTAFGLTTTGADDTATPQTLEGAASTTFTNVPQGTYSVAETVPTNWSLTSSGCSNGNAVNAIQVTPGSTVTCTFVNTLQIGNIEITKTDDDNPASALAGAVFTAYKDLAPTGGAAPDAGDLVAANAAGSCTTVAVTGKCTISGLLVGSYWLVETTTPTGYSTAAPQLVTVTAGQTAQVGFVDPRRFKVITIVCQNSTDTLYQSQVTLQGDANPKNSLAAGATLPDGVSEADLCSLGGASFGPRHHGSYTGSVTIPQ